MFETFKKLFTKRKEKKESIRRRNLDFVSDDIVEDIISNNRQTRIINSRNDDSVKYDNEPSHSISTKSGSSGFGSFGGSGGGFSDSSGGGGFGGGFGD